MRRRMRTALAGVIATAASVTGVWAANPATANTYACVGFASRGQQVGYWTGGAGDTFGLGLSAYLTVAREEVCDDVKTHANYNTAQLQQQNESLTAYASSGFIRFYNEQTYAFANGDDRYNTYDIEYSADPVSVGSRLCTRLFPTSTYGTKAVQPRTYNSTCGLTIAYLGYTIRLGDGPYTDLFYAAASYISSDVPGTPTAKTHFYAMGYGVPGSSPPEYKSYPPVLFGYNYNSGHWAYDADSATSTYMWTYKE